MLRVVEVDACCCDDVLYAGGAEYSRRRGWDAACMHVTPCVLEAMHGMRACLQDAIGISVSEREMPRERFLSN